MRYQITHTTLYRYDRPVMLAPHVLRLRPRSDVTQMLYHCSLESHPQPLQQSETVDLDGNTLIKLWFPDQETTTFTVQARSELETWRTNPFDFLLEPWATQLPIDYPITLFSQLQPYLQGYGSFLSGSIDPIANQLAQEIWETTAGNTIAFLSELNQRIYQTCEYSIRETGEPLPPGMTWTKKVGACRDVSVLFMEVCRAVGLAARFVSGYEVGDPDATERHLHAWVEVYLPGAGWRGYDPTHGLAVSDRHIALVASAIPKQAAPITGSLKQGIGAQSEMEYQLEVKVTLERQ